MDNSVEIKQLQSTSSVALQLDALLADAIDSGASLGFLSPANLQEVAAYWQSVEAEIQAGTRKLFIAHEQEQVVGCVQLSLSTKANASHRGEVEKLMVNTRQRGKGLSKLLMARMERCAADMGLSLLVLDTRVGDVASSLYSAIGYQQAGQIPQFARSSNGQLDATAYFYKLL